MHHSQFQTGQNIKGWKINPSLYFNEINALGKYKQPSVTAIPLQDDNKISGEPRIALKQPSDMSECNIVAICQVIIMMRYQMNK